MLGASWLLDGIMLRKSKNAARESSCELRGVSLSRDLAIFSGQLVSDCARGHGGQRRGLG